jgi:hypothetical protein
MHMPSHGVVDREASAGEDSTTLDVPLRDDAWLHDLSHYGLTTINGWHVTQQSEGIWLACVQMTGCHTSLETCCGTGMSPTRLNTTRHWGRTYSSCPLPCVTACYGMYDHLGLA